MDIMVDGPVLVLQGGFDVRSTSMVRGVLYDSLEGDVEHVVVDMGGVSGIDITALRLLAVATRYASLHGRTLTLRNCGPSVLRMLHLSRLAHAIEVERSSLEVEPVAVSA